VWCQHSSVTPCVCVCVCVASPFTGGVELETRVCVCLFITQHYIISERSYRGACTHTHARTHNIAWLSSKDTEKNALTHTHTHTAAVVREAERATHTPDSLDLAGSLKIQACQKNTVGVLLQVKNEEGMRGTGEKGGGEREREREKRTKFGTLKSEKGNIMKDVSLWVLHFQLKTKCPCGRRVG